MNNKLTRSLPLLPLIAALALAETGEIKPNENLVADGIPAVPGSIADAVGRYTEFRTAAFRGWHPEGREILITTRFADTNQVHRVRFPGGDRTQLTFFPDRVQGASYPPVPGDFFVLTRDIGGNEFSQIYRYDLDDGTATLITDGKRSQNGGVVWSRRGDRFAYSGTGRNGRDRDIHVVDPRDPSSGRLLLAVEGGGWGPLDWSPDDKQLVVGEGVSVNESYLWLVDVASGAKKLITPKGGPEKVAYGDAAFAADGASLYVTTDRDSEFQRLARVDLASGRHTYLTSHVDWNVDALALSRDGSTLAFVTNEDGVDVLRLMDAATGQERPRPELGLGLGLIGGLAWHPGGRELGFSFSSARSPADVYSLEVASGKVERWTHSEAGGLNPAGFVEPELVRWKSFDGRSISGFLYKPPARFSGRRPVQIEIHGGPEGQARPGFQGRDNYLVNELGVALIAPNVRGSSGYGKSFLRLDNGRLREDSVKDIGALLYWIAARPDLDPQRVMVTGGSYGGYMTLAVATHYDGRIRCSLDVVGISNFISFLERTEAYRRDLRRVEYGDERDPEMRAFFEKIAPLNNAGRISKPLFIVQGANDPRVPRNESEQMVATLRQRATPVWYLLGKDEGHGFAKKKNQDFLFYARVLFMQEHLLR